MKLRVDAAAGPDARDPKLIDLIIRAHRARQHLANDISTPCECRELLRLARLSYLAPDITTAIFEARQLQTITVRTLSRITRLRIC